MTACADAEDLPRRFLIDSSRSELYKRDRALRRGQAILNRQLPGRSMEEICAARRSFSI